MTALALRLGYAGVIAGVLAGGVWVGVRSWPDLTAKPDQLIDHRCRREQRVQFKEALCRREAKERIVEDLVAERISLREAAGLFVVTSPQPRHYLNWVRQAYPGGTEEESICRHVIHYVRRALGNADPRRTAEVVARLEAELQAEFPPAGIEQRHTDRD